MATKEVEQKIGQDLHQADINGYPEAIGIIISNGKKWGDQLGLVQAGKFKEAMTSIESSISEIERYISQYPDSKNVLAFTLARAYDNKGWCLIMYAGAQTPPNNAVARQGIQWIDKALAMGAYPPDYARDGRKMRDNAANAISQKEREAATGVVEKKKDSCAPVAMLLILLPISFMLVLWLH